MSTLEKSQQIRSPVGMHIVQNFGKEFGTFFENQPCIYYTMITFLGIFFQRNDHLCVHQHTCLYVFSGILLSNKDEWAIDRLQ